MKSFFYTEIMKEILFSLIQSIFIEIGIMLFKINKKKNNMKKKKVKIKKKMMMKEKHLNITREKKGLKLS